MPGRSSQMRVRIQWVDVVTFLRVLPRTQLVRLDTMATSEKFPLFRLLILTGAIFVSVSSEFLPTGLLPDIAADLGVSESQVGLLVTVFAFTVVRSEEHTSELQ